MHYSGGLTHTIDDGNTFDMVIFMLQGPGIESIGLVGEFVAVKVGSGDFALFISSNLRIDTRRGKAAFVDPFEIPGRIYRRIHVRFDIVPAAVKRDNKKPQLHTQLRSCQSDALVLQHDIDHLINELTDIIIDFFDRLGPPAQNSCRVMRNLTFFNIYHFSYPPDKSRLISFTARDQ